MFICTNGRKEYTLLVGVIYKIYEAPVLQHDTEHEIVVPKHTPLRKSWTSSKPRADFTTHKSESENQLKF